MALPVLLISSDPSIGVSLEALAPGRVQVAHVEPSRRPVAWPADAASTVVLDVTARQRHAAYVWVRRHHSGPLVVLLKPGEPDPQLPPDPSRLVVRRPFRLADLVAVLVSPPAPPAAEQGPGVAGQGRGVPGRWRRVAVWVLVGVLVLVVVAGAWLALGLLEARQDLRVGATQSVRGGTATVARPCPDRLAAPLDLHG